MARLAVERMVNTMVLDLSRYIADLRHMAIFWMKRDDLTAFTNVLGSYIADSSVYLPLLISV